MNLNFFKKNLGKWQITQIANNHVIMGSGYNYKVKKGTASYFFCAHPVDSAVIRDQHTMNKMVKDPVFFKKLLTQHANLTMITSDGNTIPYLILPLGVTTNQKFIIERNSTAPVKVNFVRGDVRYVHGVETSIPKGKRLTFRFNGDRWVMESNYNVDSKAEFLNKDTLNKLLIKHRSIKIRVKDGVFAPEINLPLNGLNGAIDLSGTMVFFERKSIQKVKVVFGDEERYIAPPYNSTTVFVNHWNFWFVVSEKKVKDNITLRILGNNPCLINEALEEHVALRLQTSDGNWTDNFEIPVATDVGEMRMITLIRYSEQPVKLKFPGVTIAPRKGSINRFLAYDTWQLLARKSFYLAKDKPAIVNASGIKQMLDKYGSLSISMLNDGHFPDIYLPDNATQGELVSVYRRTTKPIRVHYSGQVINLSIVERKLFYFDNQQWKIINLN